MPDAALVRRTHPADAVLALPTSRLRSAPRPVLQARPGLLRAPRTGACIPLHSLTLTLDGRSWAARIAAQDQWFTPALEHRAQTLLRHLIDARVGGTWWGNTPAGPLPGRAAVFVDAAPDPARARSMLDAAIAESGSAATLLVARHPARWHATYMRRGVRLVQGVIDPWPLLEECAHIHAVAGSDEAILATLLGAPLRQHGAPAALPPDPVQLAAAALLLGTRFVDPFTGTATPCESFLAHAAEWRRQRPGTEIACCVGISFWKRQRLAAMLGGPRPPAFRKTAAAALAVAGRRGGAIAVWPSRAPAGLDARAAHAQIPLLRVEDGFIRSKGLGADFLPPLSIVLDRLGLYYDATGPSDLESILSDARFSPALIDRAARLRARMVRDGVTKYNLGGPVHVAAPPGRRIILVPGQVADDRSVLLGGAGVLPGLDLLRRVRATAPDAYIVYKPHPDVEAGHRQGTIRDAAVLTFADQILRGGSMAALLDAVDEVHTLTSLTGFEALLRGKPVTTHGQPFYAGWGLTTDHNRPARRTRTLALDELVAGTLILYPRYFDPVTRLPCGPEIVMDRLADPTLQRVNPLVRLRRLQGRAGLAARHAAQAIWARSLGRDR